MQTVNLGKPQLQKTEARAAGAGVPLFTSGIRARCA